MDSMSLQSALSNFMKKIFPMNTLLMEVKMNSQRNQKKYVVIQKFA